MTRLYHWRRKALSNTLIGTLNRIADFPRRPPRPDSEVRECNQSNQQPETIADFRPLENACFQNPYSFYQRLRDEQPVYRLPNGVHCISRYQDIVNLSRATDTYSSAHQGVVANLGEKQDLLKQVKRFDHLARLGVIPADVLATSDPPMHSIERKIGHACLNSHFVKTLETDVERLSDDMLQPLLARGRFEFMQSFGWRLPMLLVIRLLGLPAEDYEKIKTWCVEILESQNGIQSGSELARSHASALKFLDYCWRQYLTNKSRPGDNMLGILARAAADPENPFDDSKAASAVFQIIIAGSDSSATTMGNALKMLIENPALQTQLRQDESLIPVFVEEVFRLESAFQGHFRWVRRDTELHGVSLPRGSRIFLMWASGNRDERFWDRPDELLLNRPNAKKHLTFGHGIHACLGRELARLEIKVVLRDFLRRTENLRIVGETPYVASMFARTLVSLPIAFDRRVVANHE